MQDPADDQGLSTDCLSHVHLSIDGVERSSSEPANRFSGVVGLLDWNYPYKSVATQIYHNPGVTDLIYWLKILHRPETEPHTKSS